MFIIPHWYDIIVISGILEFRGKVWDYSTAFKWLAFVLELCKNLRSADYAIRELQPHWPDVIVTFGILNVSRQTITWSRPVLLKILSFDCGWISLSVRARMYVCAFNFEWFGKKNTFVWPTFKKPWSFSLVSPATFLSLFFIFYAFPWKVATKPCIGNGYRGPDISYMVVMCNTQANDLDTGKWMEEVVRKIISLFLSFLS